MSIVTTTPRVTIFGEAAALPRGRHGLDLAVIRSSQRVRLLAAVTAVVAEKGYAAATITEVARRARVSPNVFYEHFADLEDCVVCAYDAFAATLGDRIRGAVAAGTGDLLDTVGRALDAYLSTLEGDRLAARAFLVEIDGAGARARHHRYEVYADFAELIAGLHDAMQRGDPVLGPLPPAAYLGFVHAVRGLVCDALERRPDVALPALLPDLLVWFVATIKGAAGDRQRR